MNDLTTSRSSLLNVQRVLAPSTPFLSVDAGELSFRKIQAASEPLLAKLRNAGMIAEINYICQEITSSTKLISEDGIFFGSVFIDADPTALGTSLRIDVATLRTATNLTSRTGKAVFDLTKRLGIVPYSSVEEQPSGGSAGVRNAAIAAVTMSNNSNATALLIGMMVQFTPNSEVDTFITGHQQSLGIWARQDRVTVYDDQNESNRSIANYWDGSSAATGLPGFLKPVKKSHQVSDLRFFKTSEFNLASMVPGIVIPKNFVGYLQYVRAKLNGGAQLDPSDVPVEDRTGFDALLSDILEGIDVGAITLGNDPSKFVVPAFDFNEIVQTGVVDAGLITTSAFILGFDHSEPQALAFNRICTSRAITGASGKVVALCYPIKSKDFEGKTEGAVAHDLVQLDIRKLVTSIPFIKYDDAATYDGITCDVFGPVPDHRQLSQYAYAFKYPNPILI